MKKTTLILFTVSLCLCQPKQSTAQAVNLADSMALVDLYNSTNGPNWVNHTNWLTTSPLSTWFGVFYVNGGRIIELGLPSNNLVGSLPASIGNLTSLLYLDLSSNSLTGSMPASIANLTSAQFAFFNHNQLGGPLPTIAGALPALQIEYNQFTFAGLESYNFPVQRSYYSPQADIPLLQNGNILSVAAGGTIGNNTYTWYKNGVIVASNPGDSTFTISSPGNYSVSVTNTAASQLTLYSIQTTNIQDSMALVDLFNNTSGSAWLEKSNWLTSTPVSSWQNIVTRNGRVTEIYLVLNNLQGTLPSSLGNLTALTSLQLGSNNLTGSIPASLSNCAALYYLILERNGLSGSIPSSLGQLSQVYTLDLSQNQLTGDIPSELGNINSLNILYLQNNQLSDTIPASIGNLPNLQYLYLNNNNLTGKIPSSIGRLQNLVLLTLNDNQLGGSIPDSICYLPNLAHFLLYDNLFTGKLPDSLSKDSKLLNIEVENNHLSGALPSLAAIPDLADVNISNNDYTFTAAQASPPANTFIYSPQRDIPIMRIQATISVATGGSIDKSTFTLFKDGAAISAKTGDSAFAITDLGNYNVVTTNTAAPLLTLYSDTLRLGLVLPDSTLTVQQSIAGTAALEVDTSIFRLATLTPAADAHGLSGNTTILETVDNQVSSYNDQPYVQRHYDITPANNASSAEATVTLYFTQQDFDAFNTYVTSNGLPIPLLPTNGVDNGNVWITQYHGTFTGTANPANYSQGATLIQPTVSWDATANWWTVSFPVTGFSGFFLGSGSVPLPLTLMKFSGIRQNGSDYLSWSTTNEVNTSNFGVERSTDSLSFSTIGQVKALSSPGEHDYTFTDANPYPGNNFYRLKMIDLDGQSTYSRIILIAQSVTAAFTTIYPNPAKGSATVVFNASIAGQYLIQVTDAAGNPVRKLSGTSFAGINREDINLGDLAAGTYFVTIFDQEYGKRELILNKQ